MGCKQFIVQRQFFFKTDTLKSVICTVAVTERLGERLGYGVQSSASDSDYPNRTREQRDKNPLACL